MAAVTLRRTSSDVLALGVALLATLGLSPVPALAQARVNVARFPAVLAQHFANVPRTVFPRGFDIVASDDTVGLAVWLENAGNAPATNVQAFFQSQPGLLLPSQPIQYGTLLPGASVGRIVPLVTMAAAFGPHPVMTQIFWSTGTALETTWVSIWSEQLAISDLPSGRFYAHLGTPFTSHRYFVEAPEQFASGVPDYFDLRTIRDSIDFVQPFFGTHWGECFFADHDEPGPAPEQIDATMIHEYRVHDESGHPIAGATVTQRVGDFVVSGVTDGSGRVKFTDVPTGDGADTIEPPDVLAGTYRTTHKAHAKIDPGPGMKTVTEVTYPDIPPRVISVKTGPPATGQGANSGTTSNTGHTITSGVTTGVGTGILDVLAFLSIPGAGWLIGTASVVGSALVGVGAGVGDDPGGQDLAFAGEEHTVPGLEDERTLSEQIDVAVSLDQPPRGCTQQSMTTSFTFTRFTDRAQYTWTGTDQPAVSYCLDFDARLTEPGPALVVRPLNDPSPSTRGKDYLVLAWITESTGQQALSELQLQDDGIAPDAAANDGQYSVVLPPGSLAPGNRLFVWITRSGFDAAAVPPPMVMREVSLEPLVAVPPAAGVDRVALAAPQPNPARRSCSLSFALPRDAWATLRVVDVAGRSVRTLLDGDWMSAGRHDLTADLRGVRPGLYFCSLQVRDAKSGRPETTVTCRLVITP